MALYLGNQKVSLRSGQDPTFDYGFDSNGSLVFANKNATEINNFLNYDSSYSEILDLSNLSKMEKVAVNGTVDRKMEGLKGLLVSPNAPFTGTSPQINASYTGLSKSALVSLFESVPYNVGYTKVGNPTIVDGVVSGFSASNYLQAQQLPTDFWTNDFEICVALKTPASWPSGDAYLLKGTRRRVGDTISDAGILTWWSNNKLSITGSYSNISGSKPFSVEITPQLNTKYWMKIVQVGHTISGYYSLNGSDWTLLDTANNYGYAGTPNTRATLLGQDDDCAGFSIDLNETYIKVNGVPWFGPGATKNLVPGGTVVGDVIVKDGVASGFSGSKYISVPNFSTASPLEMVIRTKYNTFKSGIRYLFSFSGLYILQDSANTIYCSIQKSDETFVYPSFPNLVSDTFYYLKLVYDGATLWAGTSTDGTTYTETYNQTLSLYSRTRTANLGYRNSGTTVWDGSIDLNNTYIKSGDTYIYRGMVPMTKTCSVVGCAGTADLTQEDKNIILNKGWSLTVQ